MELKFVWDEKEWKENLIKHDITDVYSHNQAIMQSRDFLDMHRKMVVHTYENTALAAKKVAEDGLSNQAAICSEYCASLYGLDVLEREINYSSKKDF